MGDEPQRKTHGMVTRQDRGAAPRGGGAAPRGSAPRGGGGAAPSGSPTSDSIESCRRRTRGGRGAKRGAGRRRCCILVLQPGDGSGDGSDGSDTDGSDTSDTSDSSDTSSDSDGGDGDGDSGGQRRGRSRGRGGRQRASTPASARDKYCREEADYYVSLPRKRRRELDAIEQRLAASGQELAVPLRFQVLSSGMGDAAKCAALQRLEGGGGGGGMFGGGGGEASAKATAWVSSLLRLPLSRYHAPPVGPSSAREDVVAFLGAAERALDADVYGLHDVKRQFLATIAKWVANPTARGMVLGVQGPAGVGKTTLIKDGLSRAMGLPCCFVPLGGANDASYLDGHGYTYEGSTWGRVADALMGAGVMNPVLCFDELDKVADNARGAEIFNVLIHLTDASQNDAFCDKYFAGVGLDLSRAVIVFTYNDTSAIHPILRNRMAEVHVPDYSAKEKLHILREFMLPRALQEYSALSNLHVHEDALEQLVAHGSGGTGMRGIRHDLELVLGELNLELQRSHGGGTSTALDRQRTRQLLESRDNGARRALPEGVRHMYA